MKINWNGKRVTILGGARQGQAAAHWLARHGARVTVNDRRSEAEMATARQALADTPVTWVLGGHPLEMLDTTDILCLSGGVPLDNPLVIEAVRRGIPLTNDTQIFMEAAPCPTVGITGSAGKTTTTSLLGEMARKAKDEIRKMKDEKIAASSFLLHPSSFVGGNIGDPLLNHVDEMQAGDLAILEISSFQLEQMTISPNVAAILNITPNHLDRHGTMEAYTAAKRRILEFQGRDDTAVLCRDDAGSWGERKSVRGRLATFGMGPLSAGQEGTFLADGILHIGGRGVETALLRRDQVQLRGEHNVMNVLAAFAIGYAADLPLDAMLEAAEDFRGVAHRLEFVRAWDGAKWYNDSIATAPERTMAAIRSFDEPIVLLLGGRDKNLPWADLASLVHERVDHVVLFGEAAEIIAAALGEQVPGQRPFTLERCKSLSEAVWAASRVAEPGDVVLLSPGGTSFDEFCDFEERGERFRKWVSELS
jgi:UDP-N-acetylmuramoylalanine--D-glutamate ligase